MNWTSGYSCSIADLIVTYVWSDIVGGRAVFPKRVRIASTQASLVMEMIAPSTYIS